jgi:transposase-like protein
MYNRSHYSHWSDLQKKQAVSLYLSGDYSKSSIAREFGVSHPGLSKWIDKFAEEILGVQEQKKGLNYSNNPQSETSMTKKEHELSDKDKEIARLQQQLYLSQVKNDILEAMIDIAKEDYNIDLRKKAGPRQYKKLANKKDTKS